MPIGTVLERALVDRAGAADLRQLLEVRDQAVHQVVPGGAGGKLLLVQTADRECQDLRWIEPEVEIRQPREAAQAEAGRDQEHERARDLHGDQHATRRSAVARPAPMVPFFMSSTSDVRLARSAGTRPTRTVATSAVARAKSITGKFDAGTVQPRNVRRARARRGFRARGRRRRTPKRPPAQRDEGAFGEQLPDQDAAARAERCADGEFAAARCAAREHQTRDIAARDQQHQDDGRHQQPQGLPGRTEDEVEQRRHDDPEVRKVDAILVGDCLRDTTASRGARRRRSRPASVAREHRTRQACRRGRHAAVWCGAQSPRAAAPPASSTVRRAERRTPEASRR